MPQAVRRPIARQVDAAPVAARDDPAAGEIVEADCLAVEQAVAGATVESIDFAIKRLGDQLGDLGRKAGHRNMRLPSRTPRCNSAGGPTDTSLVAS